MCVFAFPIPSSNAQTSKKLDVIVLENGIYDSVEVLNAVNRYIESVESHLGFDGNVVRLPSGDNTPSGIDAFIESRYVAGVQLFVLVGNDLKWPLNIWEDGRVAAPADGVLCDTDGELEVADDGLHQPIAYFTAEATVSYIFPPKSSLSINDQRNYVIRAFNKFEQYHNGELGYDKKGVICGNFGDIPLGFGDMANRMASSSELLFGKEKTIKKELSNSETREYLEQAPAFFGVAGHGSPQVVETSSSGDILSDGVLKTTTKAPLFFEIFGCWTAGWGIEDLNDPWSSASSFISEAAILENPYNIAMVAGFPESGPEASFANSVLSQIPLNPEATLGELMIGKERRSADWILFGDPTVKLDFTGSSPPNQPPVAIIDSISPNRVDKGTAIYFKGHGTDRDGKIVSYGWQSSLDGELSTSATFSTSTLSVGTHNIYFRVQDDDGEWSIETSRQLTITPGPSVTVSSPADGATVKGTTLISASATGRDLSFVNFYIDDSFKGFASAPPYEFIWDTTSYSNGEHKIQAKASYTNPPRTIASNTVTVILDNPLPTVTVTAPTSGSTVNGICTIEATATDSNKINRVCFYIDGLIKGYDYTPPFQWNWDTATYPNGQHTVRVEAFYRNLGKYVSSGTLSVLVDNIQTKTRTITITSPSDGSTVSGTVNINAIATGDNLVYIYLYIDEEWKGYSEKSPAQLSWNTIYSADGQHKIYAMAIYKDGGTYVKIKSEIITLTVDN
jgi:hypothetical protein